MSEAIALRRIDFEETSLIVSYIEENEYRTIIVKGAKRKNSNKLYLTEPISLVDYELTKSKKMPSLIEGIVVNPYFNIKKDLVKTSIASVMIEYSYILKDLKDGVSKIYYLLKNSLDDLNKDSIDSEIILFRFELILLNILGSTLSKEHLINDYNASESLISSIESILSNENNIKKDEFRSFIEKYYNDELGIKLKSKKIYLEII